MSGQDSAPALPATTFDQVRGWCRVAEWRPWPFDSRTSLLGHATIAFAGDWDGPSCSHLPE
jgi:hypothetical protein